MSSIPVNNISSDENAAPRLPAELFYLVCAHITSRRDLIALTTTSRVLQRPCESILQKKVTLDSRDRGRSFASLIKQCPRFAPLVKELRLEWYSEPPNVEISGYWSSMQNLLGSLTALERLVVDDGRDLLLSWILSAIPENQLKVLRCGFVLDVELLKFLRRQNALQDLSWNGSLISIPRPSAANKLNTYSGSAETTLGEPSTPNRDPDQTLISVMRQYLPSTALPLLKYLHSESLSLARALVPGRPITHLWVPGASFAAAVSSDYVYRHIAPSIPDLLAENSETTSPASLVELRTDVSNAERSERLRRSIADFGLSKGPVLSLRISMDLPRRDSLDLLACIAHHLPQLKALGYLPASILDTPSDESNEAKLKIVGVDNPSSPIPPFSHLHTVCLWSIPSRRAVTSLEASSDFPALRTLACLHFSPAFEWLCLPVNDDNDDSRDTHRGGIEWKHEMDFDGRIRYERRRLTAVHDPENLLWRGI